VCAVTGIVAVLQQEDEAAQGPYLPRPMEDDGFGVKAAGTEAEVGRGEAGGWNGGGGDLGRGGGGGGAGGAGGGGEGQGDTEDGGGGEVDTSARTMLRCNGHISRIIVDSGGGGVGREGNLEETGDGGAGEGLNSKGGRIADELEPKWALSRTMPAALASSIRAHLPPPPALLPPSTPAASPATPHMRARKTTQGHWRQMALSLSQPCSAGARPDSLQHLMPYAAASPKFVGRDRQPSLLGGARAVGGKGKVDMAGLAIGWGVGLQTRQVRGAEMGREAAWRSQRSNPFRPGGEKKAGAGRTPLGAVDTALDAEGEYVIQPRASYLLSFNPEERARVCVCASVYACMCRCV
jgi:hypothetical protein